MNKNERWRLVRESKAKKELCFEAYICIVCTVARGLSF